MNKILRASVVASLFLLAGGGRARADHAVAPVPAPFGQKSGSTIDMKVVSYDGSVNGGMTVEVTNHGQSAATFTAQGLYFVPDSNPNEAPQRLGAVGPMQVDGKGQKSELLLAPGERAIVHLDVYCIDSGRHAPSPTTAFHLSPARMPAALAGQIDSATSKAARDNGGYAAPAAKAAVQSEVWDTRNKERVKLQGDGSQESNRPVERPRSQNPSYERMPLLQPVPQVVRPVQNNAPTP
jgi:hypothetical protein